jgi:hypothetical protein
MRPVVKALRKNYVKDESDNDSLDAEFLDLVTKAIQAQQSDPNKKRSFVVPASRRA